MSDISPLVLSTLYEQLRELELDAVLIRGRTEQLRDTIALLESGPRRKPGRSRRIEAVATDTPNGPHGVKGALFHIETEPPEAAE